MKHDITHKNNKQLISSKTVGFCVILFVTAIAAVSVFKVPIKSLLTFGILLICPLMHFWMMKNGDHKH